MDGSDAPPIRLVWPGKEDSAEVVTARLTLLSQGPSGCSLVQGDNLAALLDVRHVVGADPDLRITNIHGKGYRLEIVNDNHA